MSKDRVSFYYLRFWNFPYQFLLRQDQIDVSEQINNTYCFHLDLGRISHRRFSKQTSIWFRNTISIFRSHIMKRKVPVPNPSQHLKCHNLHSEVDQETSVDHQEWKAFKTRQFIRVFQEIKWIAGYIGVWQIIYW